MPYTISHDGLVANLDDLPAVIAYVRAHGLPASLTSDILRRDTVRADRPSGAVVLHLVGPLDDSCPTCHVAAGTPCQWPNGHTRSPHAKRGR